MAGRLRHRPNPPNPSMSTMSVSSPLVQNQSASLSSSVQRRPRRRTCAGDQLPENERPTIIPVGKQWEVYPYTTSRKVAPVQGALLKLFYPDMIGPEGNKRVAKSWDDYKWSPNDHTPSAATIIKEEFWLRFKCAPDVNMEEADKILDVNLKNLARHMFSDLRKEAVTKVYEKENFQQEQDEDGNLWPKVEDLMDAKPTDFATKDAWDALCQYWSTPSFRKKSMRGKENRLAGGENVYHCSGSRGLAATRQFLKIRNGVDPGQIGAWHHQHRMQQGTNRVLCSKKAATTWARYDRAMTEKSGENWQAENPNIDHVVVHSIAGTPHGSFAMGDGVICPSDANSIKSRKRVHENSHASGASSTWSMLRQMETNPNWRAGIERVLQAITEKIDLDFNTLMHPDADSNAEWCHGVERVLQAIAEIVPVDIDALLGLRNQGQSTSTSGSGAVDGTSELRSDVGMNDSIDDDHI